MSGVPGAFHPRFADLPPVLPVFPLSGALLLPWGRLPLNVFEPRYLAMVQDALGMGRMIGMIQPRKSEAAPGEAAPPLYDVGCAGRITSFAETDDGRILMTLSGCIRFRVAQERPIHRGYRLVEPDFMPYRDDLEPGGDVTIDSQRVMTALAGFLSAFDLPVNAKALMDLPPGQLVSTVAMAFPFEPREKQALLEATTPQHRADTLLALLELAAAAGGADTLRQ